MTQAQVAVELGLDQSTIDRWEEGDINNMQLHNANIPPPDFRVKLTADNKLLLIEKAHAGESQKALALARRKEIYEARFPETKKGRG